MGGKLVGSQHPERRLDHAPQLDGAPRPTKAGRLGQHGLDALDPFRLGQQQRRWAYSLRQAWHKGLDVIPSPRGLARVDAHDELAPAVRATSNGLRDLPARDLFTLGRDSVLKVEDQRVRRQGLGLFERSEIGAWDV